jgi:Trm5-related predicted tRNA methylase
MEQLTVVQYNLLLNTIEERIESLRNVLKERIGTEEQYEELLDLQQILRVVMLQPQK